MTREKRVILREQSDRRISGTGIPPDRQTRPPEILRPFQGLRMTREKRVILREQSDRRISGRGIRPDRQTRPPEILRPFQGLRMTRKWSAAQDDEEMVGGSG
jgi:hypothetical protein